MTNHLANILVGRFVFRNFVKTSAKLVAGLSILLWSTGTLYAQPNHPVAIMQLQVQRAQPYQIQSLRDFNGDGYYDLMCGIYSDRDRIESMIFFGGNPIDTLPDIILPRYAESSSYAHAVGDLNGDGGNEYYRLYENGDYLFYNSKNYGLEPNFIFPRIGRDFDAYDFDDVGDLNADGKDDLLRRTIITSNGRPYHEYFQLMIGDTTYDTTWVWTRYNNYDSSDVSRLIFYESAGDINGDGRGDLIFGIGHSGRENILDDSELVYLSVVGGDTIPDYDLLENIPVSPFIHHKVGATIIVPDITGDGYDDMINYYNTTRFYPDDDTIYVFFGGPHFDTSPDLKIHYSSVLSLIDIAYVGDVNHDGFGDFSACFADGVAGNEHVGYIYFGGPNLDVRPDVEISGRIGDGRDLNGGLPSELRYAGDVDHNGVDDLLALSVSPFDNVTSYIFVLDIDSTLAGVKDHGLLSSPKLFHLGTVYPNPFNSTTQISYALPKESAVSLRVFDLMGREVVTLLQNHQKAGYYRVLWDGKNAAGIQVGSGMYFLQMETEGFRKVSKMMLVR
jgi:hypothetical protein